MSVTVRKVETPKDFRAFFEFPWKIYKDDPNWVPPLLSMRKEVLDKDKNPSWEYLEGDYYTAWRDDEIVGTIAAFTNRRHNEVHNENISWFGFFECKDDVEAAKALLETAMEWGQTNGYDAVRGPQSFTNMEECGLLIDGYTRPILLMPYNPPYYQKLIEEAGFHKVMDTYSMYGNWDTVESMDIRKRFSKLVGFVEKRGHITVRPLSRKHLKADFELFKEIYNQAWEHNWGFTPFTSKELDALVESLGMIVDPDFACFGYVDGDPAGFLLAVPDFGQVLQKAQPHPGEPEIFTMLKAAWHWKIRPKINWVRIPLMGVKEEYRNAGVDLVMYDYVLRVFDKKRRYSNVDVGWILETNKSMIDVAVNSIGMKIYKTYRFYEKPTTGSANTK